MVSFSLPSFTDLKKLVFSDQYVSSLRRKVVSGFGLSLVLSFIVLSVVLFNISFKTPVFQGFNGFGSHNNSSLVSWRFPFSSSSTDFSNSHGTSSHRNYTNDDGKFMALENAHVGDIPAKLENCSYIGGEGSFAVEPCEQNGSWIDKNAIFTNGEGMQLDKNRGWNSYQGVENGTVSVEENGDNRNVKGNNSNNTSIVKSEAYEHTLDSAKTEARKDGVVGNHTRGEDNAVLRVKSSYKECDIFNGRWVEDSTKPYYPPGSCPHIDRDFDCHLNGRPDDGYVKWRWQPYGCDIPSFNATDFLERLRGQKLIFVGDSLNRNMWESLVCILRHSIPDKKRVYEISGRREFKKKGFYAFRFEDYNCSVDFVSSPFLVRPSVFSGRNGTFETLRLDQMDGTTSTYHDADVIIFNTGHWWTHEKTSRGEDYYQEGNHVHPRLKVLEAYKRALVTWTRWVDKNIDESKTQIIFRGYSVSHFRGGPWNSGGQCDKETEPIYNDAHLAKYPSKMRALEKVLQDMSTPVLYLNISQLTDYRKDGHPSVYRPDYQSVQQVPTMHTQDCSHWCLPGVPDTWNELMYVSLLKSGRGSWRN